MGATFAVEREWPEGWMPSATGFTSAREAARHAIRLAREINRQRRGAYHGEGLVRLAATDGDVTVVPLMVRALRSGGLVMTRVVDPHPLARPIDEAMSREDGWVETAPGTWQWTPYAMAPIAR